MRPDYRPRCIVCGRVIEDVQEMTDGVLASDVIAAVHAECEGAVREGQVRAGEAWGRRRRDRSKQAARGRLRAMVD